MLSLFFQAVLPAQPKIDIALLDAGATPLMQTRVTPRIHTAELSATLDADEADAAAGEWVCGVAYVITIIRKCSPLVCCPVWGCVWGCVCVCVWCFIA